MDEVWWQAFLYSYRWLGSALILLVLLASANVVEIRRVTLCATAV